ncbi:DUF2130 domain-containing protein [Candidatus Saccharibacteria bacterium]|nr:DUF2130 domain-containing protein [Candidatus Saccharibacteria bacterium]
MQHEIKCPNCGKVFTIDEVSYAEIQNQVRNQEFTRELEARVHTLKEVSAKEVENAKLAVKTEYEKIIAEKNQALVSAEAEKKLAVSEAVAEITKERDRLKNELTSAAELSQSKEIMLKQNYEQQIRDREDTIERLKDMKAKLSTKMVGETLEQHCQNEFNSIRATAYPRAVFGKDNAVSESGSKGDFIFRDYDENGTEIVSIMFEMKNENDTTATKHKNEHFFKELDKDRTEKGCEYAVLVSLLEADNEFYNHGIVDVSYEYPKMYVIRPQFFLPLISIITNTARNALEYKTELARIKNQNIDITNFEEKLAAFKDSFMLNSERATTNFNKAIEDIDKSIKYLEATKEALMKTIKNFGAAENKLEDLTIKRLTRGNPTMTEMFENVDGADAASAA